MPLKIFCKYCEYNFFFIKITLLYTHTHTHTHTYIYTNFFKYLGGGQGPLGSQCGSATGHKLLINVTKLLSCMTCYCWSKMKKIKIFFFKYIGYHVCKDRIWLESKAGTDSGPRSPKQWIYRVQERKLVWSWAKILDFSVKKLKIRESRVPPIVSFGPPLYTLLFVFFIIHVWTWHSKSFFVILLALSWIFHS